MKILDRVARPPGPHNTLLVQFNREELKRQMTWLAGSTFASPFS